MLFVLYVNVVYLFIIIYKITRGGPYLWIDRTMEQIRIDREIVRNAFKEYTDRYNSEDGKIKLKIDHTYRVAAISDKISDALNLSGTEKDIAWLNGMLHDIGRFEQIKRYGTFNDAESIDHAALSADLLFDEGLIKEYIDTDQSGIAEVLQISEDAIRAHNMYRIPEILSEKSNLYARILRDADKIDILRVHIDTPMEVIYNVSREEVYNSGVTPEVMDAFYEEHCILKSLRKTPMDTLIGHLSLCYELEFPISFQIVKEQGDYLKVLKIMESSHNEETLKLYEQVKNKLTEFITAGAVNDVCKCSGNNL